MTAKSKREKAAFNFAFLKSLSQHSKMKDVDAMAAIHFVNLVGDDRRFYMSAAHLAKLLGKKSPNTGEASLKRFRANGFLIHIPEVDIEGEPRKRPNGGKLANTYQMEIPSAVSTKKMRDTIDEVSPKKLGKVSSKKMGTITSEQTLEGAGPHKAGQAQAAASDTSVVDKEDDFITDARNERGSVALEAPPAAAASPSDAFPPDNASDTDHPRVRPFAPSVIRDEDHSAHSQAAPDNYFGDPATLADLEALAAEEAKQVEWIDADDAVRALSNLWGDALPDPEYYALIAVDGFVSDYEPAKLQTVTQTVEALKALGSPEAAARIWAGHLEALAGLFSASGRGPEVVRHALPDFCAAMAENKARRAASRRQFVAAANEVQSHG